MEKEVRQSKFTAEMVDAYADKLLLGLTPEENKMILDEFDIIDRDIDLINKIPNISEVEPMSWCLDRVITELRPDIAEESVPLDELLANSDGASGDVIEVPKVVG